MFNLQWDFTVFENGRWNMLRVGEFRRKLLGCNYLNFGCLRQMCAWSEFGGGDVYHFELSCHICECKLFEGFGVWTCVSIIKLFHFTFEVFLRLRFWGLATLFFYSCVLFNSSLVNLIENQVDVNSFLVICIFYWNYAAKYWKSICTDLNQRDYHFKPRWTSKGCKKLAAHNTEHRNILTIEFVEKHLLRDLEHLWIFKTWRQVFCFTSDNRSSILIDIIR